MFTFTQGLYKTRKGNTAVVVGQIPETGILLGYVYDDSGANPASMDWYSNGKCWSDGEGSLNDIMPPKRTLWANVYKDDSIRGFYTKEQADWCARKDQDRIACILIEYTEGEGLE